MSWLGCLDLDAYYHRPGKEIKVCIPLMIIEGPVNMLQAIVLLLEKNKLLLEFGLCQAHRPYITFMDSITMEFWIALCDHTHYKIITQVFLQCQKMEFYCSHMCGLLI
uniref:Uncharacterized protein n=1 Tax=Lactuca sativa TaxID=4236 RepID=A0A9R1W3B3_LACSA|nr:hypothetical protein LSAT_V11C300119930 [Lactuca sativa]